MMLLVDISDGRILPRDRESFDKVLKSLEGKGAFLEFTAEDAKSGKAKLFAYYRGVLLPIFHHCLRDRGYNIDIDGVHQFYTMPKFGKDIEYNPLSDAMETVTKSQSIWSKDRTNEFVQDCVIDLLEEFGVDAPDSAEYLADKERQKKRRNLLIIANGNKMD